MPPKIALLLYAVFVFFLLRSDRNKKLHLSGALWLVVAWMILSGSRFVSQWIDPYVGAGVPEEGSPIDMVVFLGLIVMGVFTLSKRNIPWNQLVSQNLPVFIFFGYSGISIMWSDWSFVAMKRWVKEMGNLIMVIVVLSEFSFIEGIKNALKRSTYFFIPLSVILIKYFPEYGRVYSPWTGEAQNTGVGLNKNYLGLICMTCGFYYVWVLSTIQRSGFLSKAYKKELLFCIFFLAMVFWLFDKANSATPLVSFIAGSCVLILSKFPFVIRKVWMLFIMACLSGLLFFSLNLDETLISFLGRDASLTDRIPLWKDIIAVHTDQIFGAGYNSFWLSDGAKRLSESLWWHPNSTHNGYLDVYVNLGWVGLFLLAWLIISTFVKARHDLIKYNEYGRLRMGWLIAVVLYNFTETAFAGVNLVWFIFLLVAMEYPQRVE
jgi:exopolysaccharide production protein ExoQ